MFDNIVSILETALLVGLVYSPITIGLAWSFRLLNYPDLTCEGSAMMGGAMSAILLNKGLTLVSLPLSFIAGAFAGVMTALLHVKLKVSRLLSGIITAAILYSLTLRIQGNNSNVRVSGNTIFHIINDAEKSKILVALFVALLVFISCLLVLRSYLGRLLRALGDNAHYVVSLGRNPTLYLVIGLAISNGIIGLGGGVICHYNGASDVNFSFGLLIGALASMVIGETIYAAKAVWQHLLLCVVGTIIYNVIIAVIYYGSGGALRDILQASDVRMLTGLLLILPAIISLKAKSRYKLFNSDW